MYRFSISIRLTILLVLLLSLQACATSTSLQIAREQFRHGSTSDAIQTLSEANVSRRDQLLLHLDRGMVAQAAGQYIESVTAFERAITLVDELSYISVRDQTSSLLTNDWAKRYSGEYSERLWIHTFQMMNFLLLGSAESAAVEARRAVELFEEHGELLREDQFTRALMGLSFEAAGQLDSAQVEYRKLAEDFDDPIPSLSKKSDSELILFIATGFINPKLPGDLFLNYDVRISWPYYASYVDVRPSVTVQSQGKEVSDTIVADTTLVSISAKALQARGTSIAAKQALRIATKQGIADVVRKEDALAGDIVRLLLTILEQADTRSWETLPANMLLLRIPLPAGEQSVTVRLNGHAPGSGSLGFQRTLDVNLEPGDRQFQLLRTGINID